MENELRDDAEDRKTRIRTILALLCIVVVAVLNQTWLWGVLFAAWAAQGTLTGKAYLLEDLTSKNFPMLCRAINLVWFAIGLLMIIDAYSGASAHSFRQHAPTYSGAFAHL